MDFMPDCSTASLAVPPQTSAHSAWQAQLSLGFALHDGVSRLVERRHSGPLRVQKALYPEGGAVCHAIIVHPPGGVVGGDQLAVQATVGEGAHAFLTSPGAAKWYRANGHVSAQHIVLRAAMKPIATLRAALRSPARVTLGAGEWRRVRRSALAIEREIGHDLMAEIRETGARDQPYIARANHSNAHLATRRWLTNLSAGLSA